MVDLLILTSLYQFLPYSDQFISVPLYIVNIIYIFLPKSYLNEEVSCTEPSPSVSIPRLKPFFSIIRLRRVNQNAPAYYAEVSISSKFYSIGL